MSQSLSGWDGDFHRCLRIRRGRRPKSQSLSGWDGDFHVVPGRPVPAQRMTRRNPFQGGMGISTNSTGCHPDRWRPASRNPFQGGMGISTSCSAHTNSIQIVSQSLSGWDGDFHLDSKKAAKIAMEKSQSLSGWDGDFHIAKVWQKGAGELVWSQSLSGWDGDFHLDARRIAPETPNCVAIPFRVGWGFPHLFEVLVRACEDPSRNPFQGGMGISTEEFGRDGYLVSARAAEWFARRFLGAE